MLGMRNNIICCHEIRLGEGGEYEEDGAKSEENRKEWPMKSKLDLYIYGPAESAITSEIINKEIGGLLSIEEAIKQRKLFMLDYHDILIPYVSRVRKLKGKTLYGSRTLFFLNPDETLRPLAIELTRPPMDGKGQWKQVFTPSWHSTSVWIWRIAKAHVLAHNYISMH